ncbi:MAG: alpha/beta hydrolase [Phycisphaerales bacterium]|nr:alpha/beta hydrolase [Phycisphaerales bacterium]
MPRPSRARPRLWPRRLLIVVGGLATIGGALLTSCSMPGPAASADQIRALARRSVPASSADGPTLSYLIAGDPESPRVIYIHGTPGSASGFADFLVDPVPGLEAVSVDRLGFGKSGPSDGRGEPSFEAQAEAVGRLLVVRHGRGTILVGHSLGGPIAAWLAASRPDEVEGLVIVAGSLDPALERPGLGQRIATTALVRYFLPRTLDNAMGELDAAALQTRLLAPLLSRIHCPVIIIHGTDDTLVEYANVPYAQRMLTGAPSVEVVTLHDQGHFIPWERPDTIRAAVERLTHPGQ